MKLAAALSAALFSLLLPNGVEAETYPSHPIIWVVPFTPGGPSDIGARKIGKQLSDKLGQPILIDNRPGANGIVAAEYVAHAKPDGYTLFYGSSGPMGVNISMQKTLSYDPLKSFTAVHGIAISPMVLATGVQQPYKTFQEFIDYARKNPGKLNYSSVGIGSTQHLGHELLDRNAGVQLAHIPYKGTAPALIDVLSGDINVIMDILVGLKPQIDSGRLRPLAVMSETRLASLPDVPTTAELGYPKAVMSAWSSLAVPAGTPQSVVDQLSAALDEVLREPDIITYFQADGSIVMNDVAKEKLTAFYVSEIAKFKQIIDVSGAKAD